MTQDTRSDSTSSRPLRILLYSDDVTVRQSIMLSLGRRPHPKLPEFTYVEVATQPVLLQNMDVGGIDLAILDGEAAPAGGLGLAKQFKDELRDCPPIVVLLGRPQDGWLATWSRAEAAISRPLDAIEVCDVVVGVLRDRVPAARF